LHFITKHDSIVIQNGWKEKEQERLGDNMALPQEQLYTVDDIYDLPDGERAELIDGQIYYMAPPSSRHQKISMQLSTKISNYIAGKKGPCEVYAAPFAVFLNKDEINYVEPDISVICDKDKMDEKGCHGAPDWVIEIVSAGSRKMDYLTKLIKYKNAGVREYWVVDPDKEHIFVYNFEMDDMNEYTFQDSVKAGIYEELTIDFSEIL
jgi:Uma2 family endonuclease